MTEHNLPEKNDADTVEELKKLLNGEDFYELLRNTPDPEAQKYIDKVWYDVIYKNLKNNDTQPPRKR